MTTLCHVFLDVLKINVRFVTEKGGRGAIRVAVLTEWSFARSVEVHEYVTCWRNPELRLVIRCKEETEPLR
jgi:hypothetical protein